MIEVLWIDDECMTNSGELSPFGSEMVNYAYDEGIDITPMLSFQEGINAIKNNPKRWCAVILDIRNDKATTGKEADDFDKARNVIEGIKYANGQQEPYVFVLSGNQQYKVEGCTIRQPEYASRTIYDKCDAGYKALFDDILRIQNVSELYQWQCQYSDVLENARDLCNNDTRGLMLELLYAVTKNGIKDKPSLFNDMRKILENVMDGLQRLGYSYFMESSKKQSLNDLSTYIGKDETVSEYIQRAFHTLTRVVQDGSHSKRDAYSRLQVDEDVRHGKAPYLLRSSLYELCNILIWMRSLT